MSTRLPAVATVAVALVVAGCAAAGSSTTTVPTPIDAIRSGDGGRALVAAYLGGSCDRSAELQVRETADHVDVEVRATVPGSGACDAAGHPRTVTAMLAAPLGAREVRSGGHAVEVFDGSRLRIPSPLPAGFRLTSDIGGTDGSRSWTLTFGAPITPTAAACTPGRGVLVIEEAPLGTGALVGGLASAGPRTFGSATATLYRQGAGAGTSWSLLWSAFGGDIVLRSQVGCDGDHPLDADELVALAQTLGPV